MVLLVIRHVEQTGLEQLQEIGMPVAGRHIAAGAKRAEALEACLTDSGRIAADQDVHHGLEARSLACTGYGTQGFLRVDRPVKTDGRAAAYIAIAAIVLAHFAEIIEQYAATAHLGLRIFLHTAETLHVYLALPALPGKRGQLHDVCIVVEQESVGRQAVAPRTAYLLIEALDALRQVVVDDPPDVALVDTHAEGDGRHDDLDTVADEVGLRGVAFVGTEACVVGRCHDAMGAQVGGEFVGRLARKAVDYAALSFMGRDEAEHGRQFFTAFEPAFHIEIQIGTVERGDEHSGLAERELGEDVATGDLVGRGSERHDRHVRELTPQDAELCIFRTEVVAPLADTVSLVDGEEAHADIMEKIRKLRKQCLGGQVEELDLTLHTLLAQEALLASRKAAVERDGRNAVGPERLDLVLHERDKRGDNNRRPLHFKRRNLVAEALAASCGHQDKAVAPRHDVADDFLLPGTERVVAEVAFKRIEEHGGRATVRC
ncbi:putative uncharacterized protein [Prevotella sp. CAG:755]|nr:putative uncharacterized protein [Prevotella sp. CAG:755]